MKKTLIYLFVLIIFVRCGDDGTTDSDDFDRTELLINISDGFVVPSLNQFSSSVTTLNNNVTAFNLSPNQANLDQLRTAFKTAYLSWQNVNMFEFGPAENIAFRANINTYPADVTNINSLITNGNYNLDALSNYDSKGFPALDYLLYKSANSDVEIIDLFNTNADKEKFQTFLADVSADILQKTTDVSNSWNTYQTDFKDNKTNDIGSSISLFINSYISHYESRFRTLKIGLPAGVFSIEGFSFPEECEGLYAEISKELIIENFNQLEKLYYGASANGINSIGIEEYLVGVDASDINDDIKAQLSVIKSSLNDLSQPLSEQVVNDRPAVLAIYTEIQKLLPLLKADMTSALSIQITYTDTDGD